MTIVVVDYGRGNLFSIGQALSSLGFDYQVSSDPDIVLKAERIVFPGVGAFADAMGGLRERNLVEPIKEAVSAGSPLLGICVGCQLLMSTGEEFGRHKGLDILKGRVARLPEAVDGTPNRIRIPNVGWRQLHPTRQQSLFEDPAGSLFMYFVHSYAPIADDPEQVLATIEVNGTKIPVAVGKENVCGVQFHPEKSGQSGLRFIKRFLTG